MTLSLALNPREEQVLNQVAELPQRLLAALERHSYGHLDPRALVIMPYELGNVQRDARFIRVEEVVYSADMAPSFHLYNMQNVISSMRDGSHSLAYVVSSDRRGVQLLMGVRSLSVEQSRVPVTDYVNVLYRNLRANFPGIVLGRKPLTSEQCDAALIHPLKQKRYLAAITGVPSLRNAEQGGMLMQSVDRLVDALRGEAYLLLVLAEPVADTRVLGMLERLRQLSADIHQLVRHSISISQNQSESQSRSTSQAMSIGVSLGTMLAPFFGPSVTKTLTDAITSGVTRAAGMSITRERIDKTAQFCEQMLDQSLVRLQNGRSLGFWNVGVYLASDNPNAFLRAQSITRSLYTGHHGHFEPLRILDLTQLREIENARTTLSNLWNLRLDPNSREYHPLGEEYQHLSTPLTTEELSVLVSLPHREVPGLKVSPAVDFNLNPPAGQGDFEIGSLLYRDEVLPMRVALSAQSLTRHTFVTGLTGSGKTNTCLALLADAYRNRRLNFIVIDPAKTEYRFLLNAPELGSNLLVFTLGDETVAPFRLNPFAFARGFPLLSHIDLIKAIFNAAFPMYASMPYLLEKAVLTVYEDRGWDIATSTNRFVDVNDPQVDYTSYLPRLRDLYATIDKVVATEGYDTRLRLDLTAALKARLGSLLRGGKGLMLDTQRSIPMLELLKRPVVFELRRISDEDEKAFIMALLFTALYEVVQTRPLDGTLRHVTLIEEAHRLLRNLPTTTSSESANPRGKAIEMFTDMMAEMRAYGEGFIIVDQMPGKLVPDVIKGSNLKIVHRLMAHDDRLAVGNAMGLTTPQIDYLQRLTVGKAAIHSEELEEACLIKVDLVEDALSGKQHDAAGMETETTLLSRISKAAVRFYTEYPGLWPARTASRGESGDAQPTASLSAVKSEKILPAEALTLLLAAPLQTCVFCKALHETKQCKYRIFVKRRLLADEAFTAAFRTEFLKVLDIEDSSMLWARFGALERRAFERLSGQDPELQRGILYCFLAYLVADVMHAAKSDPKSELLTMRVRRARGILKEFENRY